MAVGMRKYCEHKPSLGDEIVILGYPSVGSTESITVTEGIVSGFETNYLVTSAKIEQGNSGGAAIDASKACYWRIPTYARSGYVESLARILKWDSF